MLVYTVDDNTLLGITVTGYSNDIMGMEYIQHFHKMTEKRTPCGKCHPRIGQGARRGPPLLSRV
jgi:hypothetical protein